MSFDRRRHSHWRANLGPDISSLSNITLVLAFYATSCTSIVVLIMQVFFLCFSDKAILSKSGNLLHKTKKKFINCSSFNRLSQSFLFSFPVMLIIILLQFCFPVTNIYSWCSLLFELIELNHGKFEKTQTVACICELWQQWSGDQYLPPPDVYLFIDNSFNLLQPFPFHIKFYAGKFVWIK